MEIRVNAATLSEVASKAVKVVPAKSVLPITDCFLVRIGDRNELVATDLETTMVCDITTISSDAAIEFCVNAKLFTTTLKNLKDEDVTIAVDEETVSIMSKNGRFTMPRYSHEEYPVYGGDDAVSVMSISAGALMSITDKVMFAIGNDELRPVMNGVSFKALPDGALECCATDAQVLSLVSMPSAVDTEASFIVPRKALSMIKSFIPQGEVEVAVSKGVVLFESATISIYSRLVEGNYPNYKAVIPSSHVVSVDFAKSDMEEAMRIVNVFSDKMSKRIRLNILPSSINCVAQDIDYQVFAEQSVPCASTGEDKVAVNATKFVDAISALGVDVTTVRMSIVSGSAPVIMRSADESVLDHLVLVMPMLYE